MVAEFVTASLDFDRNSEVYANNTQAELDTATQRKDLISNKVVASLNFVQSLSEETNLDSATNANDTTALDADATYQASVNIIANITHDSSTLDTVTNLISSLTNNSTLAIRIINSLKLSNGSMTDNSSLVNQAMQTISAPSGKLVDPYIEGSVLCEDANSNGSCDVGEETSSVSTQDGDFSFSQPLTPGRNVIIQAQGTHVGKTYDLEISGVVAADGSIDIVSPLTTLESKELTSEQIAVILNKAAQNAGISSWTISAADTSSDPLSNSLLTKNASAITDDDLVKIQASLATYGLLRIIKGSDRLSELTANELYFSAMEMDQEGAVSDILSSMFQGVSNSLNKDSLVALKDSVTQAKAVAQTTANSIAQQAADTQATATAIAQGATGAALDAAVAAVQGQVHDLGSNFLEEPTVEDIIHVSVVIIDRISEVGYNKCNETGGDYTAAISEANQARTTILTDANIMSIGKKLYGMKNSTTLSENSQYIGDTDVTTGISDTQSAKVTYRFNSSNVLVAQ